MTTFENVYEELKSRFKIFEYNSAHCKFFPFQFDNFGATEGLEIRVNLEKRTIQLYQYQDSGYSKGALIIDNDLDVIQKLISCFPSHFIEYD